MRGGPERGQAAVETALVMPLTLFLILGTMQLFLALQARVMAQYAVERAVRSGALHHGSCDAMRDTALVSLLPTFYSFKLSADPARKVSDAFRRMKGGSGPRYHYDPKLTPPHDGPVFWLTREAPVLGNTQAEIEQLWDLPPPEGPNYTLQVRLLFWYPLRIPFANKVISQFVLARWGLQPYTKVNPLLVAQQADWGREGTAAPATDVGAELLLRAKRDQFLLPIETQAAMRMMTPPRVREFRAASRACRN